MKKITTIIFCFCIMVLNINAQNLTFGNASTVKLNTYSNKLSIKLNYGNSDQFTNAGAFTVIIYLSKDLDVTTTDFPIFSFNQPSATAGFGLGNLTVPDIDLDKFIGSLINGTYYVGAIIDVNNQVAETNENDNTTIITPSISVTLWNGTLVPPSPISPLPNATQVNTTTSLKWNESNEAESYDWEVYKGTSLFKSGNVTTSSVSVSLNSSTLYKWRVRAKKSTTTTAYTAFQEFFTVIPAPTLFSPASEATNVSLTPTLVWSKNGSATSYFYRIYNSSNTLVTSGSITDTIVTISNANSLKTNTYYHWNVYSKIGTTFGLISSNFYFTTTTVSDVDKSPIIPLNTELLQNYPNPFNPTTVIAYHVAVDEKVSIKIFDVIGKEVATLVNEVKEAGAHSVPFDGAELSSGIYFVKLQSEKKIQFKKMLLLR